MEKGKEPSKNMVLNNILRSFNSLGSMEYKFQCRVVPIRQEDWTFVSVTTSHCLWDTLEKVA